MCQVFFHEPQVTLFKPVLVLCERDLTVSEPLGWLLLPLPEMLQVQFFPSPQEEMLVFTATAFASIFPSRVPDWS